MKMDAKIDMLHQSGLFGKTPGKSKKVLEDLKAEVDVEMSIVSYFLCSPCLALVSIS